MILAPFVSCLGLFADSANAIAFDNDDSVRNDLGRSGIDQGAVNEGGPGGWCGDGCEWRLANPAESTS